MATPAETGDNASIGTTPEDVYSGLGLTHVSSIRVVNRSTSNALKVRIPGIHKGATSYARIPPAVDAIVGRSELFRGGHGQITSVFLSGDGASVNADWFPVSTTPL